MATGEDEFSLFARFDPFFKQALADNTLDSNPLSKSELTFVTKYGSMLYSLFNVTDSITKMLPHYTNTIFGMEINFGTNPEVIGSPMDKIGSFHGVFVPLLDTTNKNYQAFIGNAYQTAGAKALSIDFQNMLYQFMKTGNPSTKEITWPSWQTNHESLVLDASKEKVSISTAKKSYDYEQVLKEMQNDTSVPEERKEQLIKTVLNSRWFSKQLDQTYHNLDPFYK